MNTFMLPWRPARWEKDITVSSSEGERETSRERKGMKKETTAATMECGAEDSGGEMIEKMLLRES